ncbi:MAG: TMEM165/GDT1 family protein [Mycobacteriales bacterium]
MLSLSVVATVFVVIFLAELPDKSLFASLVLGTRYRAPWVWLGVSAAFVVHVLIAVTAGGVLTLLPHRLVELVVAVLFGIGAYLMLRPGAEQDNEAADDEEAAALRTRAGVDPSAARVIATSFAVVFIGEWGDITQIATANLAAKYSDPVSVGVGAALGLVAVAGLAIKAGATVLQRVSIGLVRRVAGSILAAFAIVTAVQLVR